MISTVKEHKQVYCAHCWFLYLHFFIHVFNLTIWLILIFSTIFVRYFNREYSDFWLPSKNHEEWGEEINGKIEKKKNYKFSLLSLIHILWNYIVVNRCFNCSLLLYLSFSLYTYSFWLPHDLFIIRFPI